MTTSRGNPTLASSSYWKLICDWAGYCVAPVRLLWLSDEPVAHSEGGKSSRTSGWIICAMTGWACLSCMIFVISRINASGSSTNAWASASGLSSTMAMSISPPSFLMRAVLPSCILFKIATALFSHMHRSHSSMALCASDPVCDGTVWTPGVPSALRKALSGISEVGRVATADATRQEVTVSDFIRA